MTSISNQKLKDLCFITFNSLESKLLNVKANDVSAVQLDSLPAKAPLFVTWTKNGKLRGCIGTFKSLPLIDGLREYALIAALQDPRFRPITAEEIPQLSVAITLLGPLERIKDPLDWTIGKHGVQADFQGGLSATYLPEIAEEQGWSKEETLESLADKAGAPSIKGIKMSRYEGLKASLSYKDFKKKYP